MLTITPSGKAAIFLVAMICAGEFLFALIGSESGPRSQPLNRPAAGPEIPVSAPAPTPDGQVANILAHPLFQVVRTQSPVSQPEEHPQTLPRLAGVAVSSSLKLAILEVEGTDKPLILGLGGNAAGWTIERITASSVSIRRSDDLRIISLSRRTDAGDTAEPPQIAQARILATKRTDPQLQP